MSKLKKALLLSLFLFLIPVSLHSEERLTRKQRLLISERIKEYDEPILEWTRARLLQEFGPGRVYPVNLFKTTKSIIWQARESIRKGKRKPINGIIRNFWYTDIKPVLARADSLKQDAEQGDILNRVLVRLVREKKLMRYRDMGFLDQNEGNRQLGKNLNIILIGEKHGKYPALKRIARELDCTVLTLGGQPSLLSMEYLVDEYKARGFNLQKNIYAIFVVDYDPAGWIIRDSVLKDLRFYGMSHLKPINIIVPTIFTKKEIDLIKIPLPKKQEVLNKKWLKKSNGINGQPYGFESDAIPFSKLKKLITNTAKPHLNKTQLASGEPQ